MSDVDAMIEEACAAFESHWPDSESGMRAALESLGLPLETLAAQRAGRMVAIGLLPTERAGPNQKIRAMRQRYEEVIRAKAAPHTTGEHVMSDKAEQRAREIVRELLEYEGSRASNGGDCTCWHKSRDHERAYEMGQCPHQRAREWLRQRAEEV